MQWNGNEIEAATIEFTWGDFYTKLNCDGLVGSVRQKEGECIIISDKNDTDAKALSWRICTDDMENSISLYAQEQRLKAGERGLQINWLSKLSSKYYLADEQRKEGSWSVWIPEFLNCVGCKRRHG